MGHPRERKPNLRPHTRFVKGRMNFPQDTVIEHHGGPVPSGYPAEIAGLGLDTRAPGT